MNQLIPPETINQIMFVFGIGIFGVLCTYMPPALVALHYIDEVKKAASYSSKSSIWSFFIYGFLIQFASTIFFIWMLMIIGAIIKTKGFDANNAIGYFWRGDFSFAMSPDMSAIATVITVLRGFMVSINAFLPIIVVLTGFSVGYLSARRDNFTQNGIPHTQTDSIMTAVRGVLGMMVALVFYFGWASMASYTLRISEYDGKTPGLVVAANLYWKKAVGISSGKDANTIKF